MAISSWLLLAGACLLSTALGFWAVAQIFPNRKTTREPNADSHRKSESLRT